MLAGARVSVGTMSDHNASLSVLRRPSVQERTGLYGATLDRLERAGRFPRRLKLGPRAVGWLERDIARWIEARARERS